MCLGVPGKVIEVDGEMQIATVDFWGHLEPRRLCDPPDPARRGGGDLGLVRRAAPARRRARLDDCRRSRRDRGSARCGSCAEGSG